MGLVDIKLNIDPVAGLIDRHARRMRYVTYTTLNRAAALVREDEVKEMRAVLDRPTPYTLNSISIDYANRDRLKATVDFKAGIGNKTRSAERWIGVQARGGPRRMKAAEGQLSRNVLGGRPVFLVPAKDAPLDAYGNVSRGAMVKILSSLRALGENSKSKTRKSRGKRRQEEYFAIYNLRPGLKPGIYRRIKTGFGNAVVPIFFFARKPPTYSVRFDFDGVARRSVDQNLQRIWREVLAAP
jgi:hypothetical protein